MAEEVPETTAQRDERVRVAEEDRAKRVKKAPLTGVLTRDDVVRHLVVHGPARTEAERNELLGVLDGETKDDRVENVRTDQTRQPGYPQQFVGSYNYQQDRRSAAAGPGYEPPRETSK